jgi:hypothetical protein
VKFIIFNLMVAAALVFLFTSEKQDVTNIASKAKKEISDLKKEVINSINDRTSAQSLKSTDKKDPAAASDKPSVLIAAEVQPKPSTKTNNSRPQQKKVRIPTSSESELVTIKNPRPLDKDVLKRRSVVLGTDTGTEKPKKALSFMPPTTRHRELLLLAEEMELLAAKLDSE